MEKILVVDDEVSMRDFLDIMLRKEGYEVELAGTGREAMRLLEGGLYDLVISDLSMGDLSGLDILRRSKEVAAQTPVMMITAYASTESAIDALKLGACDYVIKPFNVDELKIVIRNALERRRLVSENQELKRELRGRYRFEELVGRSPKMKAVLSLVEKISMTGSTVLVQGESGTGKELVARAIHFNSPRADKPFISINCGALPDELLESELFGHTKGSFTGAISSKKGLFEVADGGSIFLDEIGETSTAMQVKLLRVLQERRIRRVGGTEEIPVNVRIIAATNQDLAQAVRERRFREDLFYRINVIPLPLPPLREKKEDIPTLAEHFLAKVSKEMGKPLKGISRQAMELLEAHAWPGNVRELENVIERAVALESAGMIQPQSLPPEVREGRVAGAAPGIDIPEEGLDLESRLEDLRVDAMRQALERSEGVQSQAARQLGMTFRSFRYFAKKYGLARDDS
ncbi:MAG: sigma-54 dependent transcriptional regulator [Acidobacteriota bacterium]